MTTVTNASEGLHTEVYLPRISLSEKGGYIWVDKEREILMSISLFAELRAAIISAYGERAPTALYDIGHRAGLRWATNDLNKKKIEQVKVIEDAYCLAAQIFGLGGHGELRLSSDIFLEDNVREIRFDVYSSSEVEAQALVNSATPSAGKCCWLLSGFLSGYMSLFLEEAVTFEEHFCRAQGNRICHMVGRTGGRLKTTTLKDAQHSTPRKKHLIPVYGLALPTITPSNFDDGLDDPLIIGHSSSLKAIYGHLIRAAATVAPVLIAGETGVGKELFARALHQRSPRRSASFIAINCAALPDTLIESELFGAEKGAYSGADISRPGRFERAHGGTLFLDEINSLSLAAQAKLLRALQEGEIERLGGSKTISVDVRVVCASNMDLLKAVETGEFRADLYFRLSTFTLFIPPLRERREDIPLLAEHYVRYYSEKYGKHVTEVSEEAYQKLMNYQYPGNVRELASIIERAVVLKDDNCVLSSADLNIMNGNVGGKPVNLFDNKEKLGAPYRFDSKSEDRDKVIQSFIDKGVKIEEITHSMVVLALEKTDGNITKAAKLIGMSRRQLSYLINSKGSSDFFLRSKEALINPPNPAPRA